MGMESVINVAKSLIEKNSHAWLRISPSFHPIGESISLNSVNNKYEYFLNSIELLSISAIWTPRLFQKCLYRSGMSFF